MFREKIERRANASERLLADGLSFHDWDNYWAETSCYRFSSEQIDMLEETATNLHLMCKNAVKYAIDNSMLSQLQIPVQFHKAIEESFKRDDFSLYGRFDFAYDGVNPPKMLEYNADTPTSLLESAVCQWTWLEDVRPNADQFNMLHDKLIAQWKKLPIKNNILHFASVGDNEEDFICTHYLMDTAIQAGFEVKHVYIEGIGYNHDTKYFVDHDDMPIDYLFKLYPWEWLQREEFGEFIVGCKTQFIEPIWKSVLSNKGILPILYKLYPAHENILRCHFDSPHEMTSYAKKPIFSREGADVQLVSGDNVIATNQTAQYGSEGYIYQELVDMPKFDDMYPVIGAWIVGDEAAGICIREDNKQITTNMSNFVCHYFE